MKLPADALFLVGDDWNRHREKTMNSVPRNEVFCLCLVCDFLAVYYTWEPLIYEGRQFAA